MRQNIFPPFTHSSPIPMRKKTIIATLENKIREIQRDIAKKQKEVESLQKDVASLQSKEK